LSAFKTVIETEVEIHRNMLGKVSIAETSCLAGYITGLMSSITSVEQLINALKYDCFECEVED
jgi:hypothetical protein